MGAYCIYYTHTYAVAFPLLRQLLCQSGELITGKQICLGSPHRTHTNTNKHTHIHTHPSSLYPKHLFPASGPQEPGAASQQPRRRSELEAQREGTVAGGPRSGSSPAAPEHLPLLPLLPLRLTNQPMAIRTHHLTGKATHSADAGGINKRICAHMIYAHTHVGEKKNA